METAIKVTLTYDHRCFEIIEGVYVYFEERDNHDQITFSSYKDWTDLSNEACVVVVKNILGAIMTEIASIKKQDTESIAKANPLAMYAVIDAQNVVSKRA